MFQWLWGTDSAPDDYFSPRFAYARQMGEDAAIGLSIPWTEAQGILQCIWRQESAGVSWEEARPVVHYAWRLTKEAIEQGEHPA